MVFAYTIVKPPLELVPRLEAVSCARRLTSGRFPGKGVCGT